MPKKQLVTIVIPTKNSQAFLESCLKRIAAQTYSPIETLIVDSGSTDRTIAIAQKYRATVISYKPNVSSSLFDAPYKRNYGARKAKGAYVYIVDADMELSPGVVAEAVDAVMGGASAVIVPEDSFGEGIWARAKQLERRCYWGDDTVEAPRFFDKAVWKRLGGLDEDVAGGGDDWDMYQKLMENGYTVARTRAIVRHNEGRLELGKLMKKRFMYGRESLKYIRKRPKAGFVSYFPIRPSYIRNWRLFITRPVTAVAFIIMRTCEYAAGLSGVVYSFVR